MRHRYWANYGNYLPESVHFDSMITYMEVVYRYILYLQEAKCTHKGQPLLILGEGHCGTLLGAH